MGLFIYSSPIFLCSLFLLSLLCISATHASPSDLASHVSSGIIRRDGSMMNNTVTASSQGHATDAGRTGFNSPTKIWLCFSLIVGVPMSLGGFRANHDIFDKLARGVGVGLAAAIASWGILVNAVPFRSNSDLIISIVTIVLFLCGAMFGVLNKGKTAHYLLAITGGLAFGIRFMITKSNLLISGPRFYPCVWVLICFWGLAGAACVRREKFEKTFEPITYLFCCVSTGTFLLSLGIDILVNKQAGMSRGLRFLFDRNPSHDTIKDGYFAPVSTQIIIGVFLCITPILAYYQYYIFKKALEAEELNNVQSEYYPGERPHARAWREALNRIRGTSDLYGITLP